MNQQIGDNHYFALFGLPVGYAIDRNALKQAYLILQKKYHPDQIDDDGKQSDLINDAYKVLNEDAQRAIYLLALFDKPVNLDQSIDDWDFLDLMMDSRIVLAESNDLAQIAHTRQTLSTLKAQISVDFEQAFAQKDWASAKLNALKLKFLAKLDEDFNEIKPSDDSGDDLYV